MKDITFGNIIFNSETLKCEAVEDIMVIGDDVILNNSRYYSGILLDLETTKLLQLNSLKLDWFYKNIYDDSGMNTGKYLAYNFDDFSNPSTFISYDRDVDNSVINLTHYPEENDIDIMLYNRMLYLHELQNLYYFISNNKNLINSDNVSYILEKLNERALQQGWK